MMGRPSFLEWAESSAGLYLFDKQKPVLAEWIPYHREILAHCFPGGNGRLPYNRVCWSLPKKSGKSELAAGLHLWFSLFVDPPAECYVLSNDLAGSTTRVFRAIIGSLERNPKMVAGRDWQVVGTEIRLGNKSIIRAIPADMKGEAGGNQSFVSVDEAWGIPNSREGLMTEFAPVPTRENSTTFYTGYQAPEDEPGFWNTLLDKGLEGEPVPELAHLDNGDGGPACWKNGRLFVYLDHKPRMPWHTAEYLQEQRAVLPANEYLRVWENRRVSSTDAFCTGEQWDTLYDPTLRGLHVKDERRVVLAVDAATKSDCLALVGTTWNEATKKVEVVFVQIWQPESGRPLKLTETIGPEVIRLARQHRVEAVYFDPYQMAAIMEICRAAGVNMVEFPQTSRRVQSDTHLHQIIWGGNLAHYGDPTLREHITNAMSKSTERGQRIVKELSSRKIDGAVALSMAALAAVEVLASKTGQMIGTENLFYR